MALTAEQIQKRLDEYFDSDEGKNLLAPMGMQAGGRLVGFAGPDRLTNNEEDKEEQESVFTSEEGSSFLTDLTEGLVESGVLQYGVNLGGASAVSAASQIPGIAGAINLFGSATESAVNFISSLGTSTAEELITTSGAAAAGAEASALPFGFNPITAAYFLYNVIPAIGKQISGQTDNLRKELSRLAAYKPGTGSFGKQQKGAIEFNTQLRDFAVKLIEAGWDPDRGFIQQAQEGDPKLLGSFYEIVNEFPAVVGYFGDRFGEEIFNNPTEETAESGEVIDSAQEKYEETELEEGLQEDTEAAEEELQGELDDINAENSEDITNEDVKETVESLEEATTNTQTAEEAVKVSTQSYSDYLAGVGMEDLDRTIAANEAQLRRIPRLLRRTRGKFYQRRIDKAKAEKRNRLVKAKQIADTAKVDLENAKKAEALARKEAEDARKSASAEARRKFETKQKEFIADKQKAADAAAAERKAKAEERAEERADYTKVEGTPDTDTTAPEADPIEVTSEVEPFEEPEDPPLDVKEPVVEEPEETKVTETAETEEAEDDGSSGAGEGAGAGQGGDKGADAETGTTTAETTTTETPPAETPPAETSGKGAPEEERWSYLGDNRWIRVKDIPVYLSTGLGVVKKPNWPDLEPGIYTVTPKDVATEGVDPDATTGGVADSEEVTTSTTANTQQETDLFENIMAVLPVTTKDEEKPTEEPPKKTETVETAETEEPPKKTETVETTETEEPPVTTTTTTDTTTTADTSTETAGATTTPTETTTGEVGADEDLGASDTAADTDQAGAGADGTGTGTTGPADEIGAGDADATGTGTGAADVTGSGTGVSGTPGAGAGDVGDPGDVGEGTGTGTGVGSGTGSGTGDGTGDGTGKGTGRGFDFGSQQLLQALQPQQVQVRSAPVADIGTPYTFESIFADPKQEAKFISPYGPRKRAAGGVINADPDSILRLLGERPKPANDINELLRIIGGK